MSDNDSATRALPMKTVRSNKGKKTEDEAAKVNEGKGASKGGPKEKQAVKGGGRAKRARLEEEDMAETEDDMAEAEEEAGEIKIEEKKKSGDKKKV